MSLRSNTEQFIEKARLKHGNDYDYSLVDYINGQTKVKIKCLVNEDHGYFDQTPNCHLRPSGCPMCAKTKLGSYVNNTKEKFIEQSNIVHENKYDYTLVKYSNNKNKVKIICHKKDPDGNEHGVFEQTPNNHVSKHTGCPICFFEIRGDYMFSNTEYFIEKAKAVHANKYDYSLVEYKGSDLKVNVRCEEHGIFEQTPNSHTQGSGCPRCANVGVSSQEDFIFDNFGLDIIRSNRTILGGKELDLYFPDNNIAIEINGAFWHSDIAPTPKDKSYHLDKTNECESKGIQLLHFWDFEINDKPEIVLSVIRSKLGITENKIYARKCVIKEISNIDARVFLDQNHMQGAGAIGSIKYGLYYENELVSLMTFGLSRFNKHYEYELIRFCNKLNTSVVGGASRLFKHSNLNSVVSYANKRWSDGGLYKTLGFEYLHTSTPNYFYIKGSKTLTRNQCQKHKLAGLLGDDFNPNKTEFENMADSGYGKCYDCGNMVFGYSK